MGGVESVDSDMEREAPHAFNVPVRITPPTLQSSPPPKGHPPTSRPLINGRLHRLLLLLLLRETLIPYGHQLQLA